MESARDSRAVFDDSRMNVRFETCDRFEKPLCVSPRPQQMLRFVFAVPPSISLHENIDYYMAKLDELMKKCATIIPSPEQETLQL